MKSYKLARKLQKCGLFAVNEDEDGSVRTNFLNPTFLALLLIRCIAIGSFLYFLIINAILLKLSIPFILIIGVNTFGTIGSQLYTFILPFTAQRFGTNTFTGESQMSLKAQIMALIPFLMFITGNVLNQVSGFDQTLPWISKICLIVTLCFINVFGFIDCAAVVLVFYSWIIDLKLKINRTLTESKSQLSHYDKIYHDYSKLKNAMEPITFMIFCLVQLLCIASVYLAFTGYLSCLLQFFGLLLLLLLTLSVLSDLYTLMDEVADHIEELALKQITFRNLFRYNQMSAKLGRAGVFTGMGYFTVEHSTITALLGTTLTYLIVLFQYNF